MNPDWLVPQWPAPRGVGAVCSTRAGGVSLAPYGSLNLGLHVGDDADHVQTNRDRLQQAIGGRAVFLEQVHGTRMVDLNAGTPHHQQADGSFTAQRGVACTVMVADCLPVLLCDAQGSRVAAVHAGWRGLAGSADNPGWGVLETIFQVFALPASGELPTPAPDVMAWLGPCIGPQAFEVGDDVRAAFVNWAPAAAACFRPLAAHKWLADLPALARLRLRALGITAIYGNDGSADWCTVGNPSRFFSHRRDRVSGRQAACIWLD